MKTSKESISAPTIEISKELYEDEHTGQLSIFPKVRAYHQGYSMGVIALTEIEDLVVLRRSIDKFLTTNNYINMDKQEKEEKVAPRYASLIENYLWSQDYKPMNRGNFDIKTMVLMTSQEIIIDLADMVDLELNDVADAMLYLGYCTSSKDGKIGWLLKRAPHGED